MTFAVLIIVCFLPMYYQIEFSEEELSTFLTVSSVFLALSTFTKNHKIIKASVMNFLFVLINYLVIIVEKRHSKIIEVKFIFTIFIMLSIVYFIITLIKYYLDERDWDHQSVHSKSNSMKKQKLSRKKILYSSLVSILFPYKDVIDKNKIKFNTLKNAILRYLRILWLYFVLILFSISSLSISFKISSSVSTLILSFPSNLLRHRLEHSFRWNPDYSKFYEIFHNLSSSFHFSLFSFHISILCLLLYYENFHNIPGLVYCHFQLINITYFQDHILCRPFQTGIHLQAFHYILPLLFTSHFL